MRNCILALLFLSHIQCADDIKGEKGEKGEPGQATATTIIALKKPKYEYNPNNVKQIQVAATETRPTRVLMGGNLYVNTQTVTLDVTTSLRGGIDYASVEPAKIYYLYAIPAESGENFDLIASLNDPNTGPLNFSSWSYLGAFRTEESTSNVLPFRKEGNDFRFAIGSGGYQIFSGGVNPGPGYSCHDLGLPKTTSIAVVQSAIEMNGVPFDGWVKWSLDGLTFFDSHHAANHVTAPGHRKTMHFPLIRSDRKICYLWANGVIPTGWYLHAYVQGWVEDPMDWP